jgi:hypothetical protein
LVRRLGILIVVAGVVLAGCGGGTSNGDNAPGTQADAPALQTKAALLTDLIAKNDWPAVRADFDATMRAALSESGLADAWRLMVTSHGAYGSRGEPTRVEKPGNLTVFDTPMTFAKAPAKSRLTFHADGSIAGLFLLEPAVP